MQVLAAYCMIQPAGEPMNFAWLQQTLSTYSLKTFHALCKPPQALVSAVFLCFANSCSACTWSPEDIFNRSFAQAEVNLVPAAGASRQ